MIGFIINGMHMNISEELEEKLDTIFVIVIAIFIIILWFLVMPSS